MKNLFLIVAIVFACLAASCTHRTCPTYTKGLQDVQQNEQVEVEKERV